MSWALKACSRQSNMQHVISSSVRRCATIVWMSSGMPLVWKVMMLWKSISMSW
jgi:hypothetical protein